MPAAIHVAWSNAEQFDNQPLSLFGASCPPAK
jgi:hypothetical protein